MQKKRKIASFVCMFVLATVACAHAEDTDLLQQQIDEKQEIIRELKAEIQQIDSEMSRCQRAKKGWTAATIVGGVGVVATGGAAIAQVVKAKNDEKQKAAEKNKTGEDDTKTESASK